MAQFKFTTFIRVVLTRLLSRMENRKVDANSRRVCGIVKVINTLINSILINSTLRMAALFDKYIPGGNDKCRFNEVIAPVVTMRSRRFIAVLSGAIIETHNF